MTIAVLSLHFVSGDWAIESPDAKFKITSEEACVSGKCAPVGEVTVDERGMWHVPSIEVDMRWASEDTVELRTADSSWFAADFKVATQPEKSHPTVPEEVTRWDRGVLPGFWVQATDGCAADTTAWLYQPLLKESPATMVQMKGAEVKVTTEAHIAPCRGSSKISGVYAGKPKAK